MRPSTSPSGRSGARRLLALALLAAPFASAGCITSPNPSWNHWSMSSVEGSMANFFLGYDPDVTGSYRNQVWADKLSINLTAQRHLFNWNPMNPNQPAAPRPFGYTPAGVAYAPLPDFAWYMHAESIVWGGILMAATAGTFIPIPVGTVLGQFAPGGGEEFARGMGQVATPVKVLSVSFVNETIGEGGPVVGIFGGAAQGVQRERIEAAKNGYSPMSAKTGGAGKRVTWKP
jgi:hypothetical protein